MTIDAKSEMKRGLQEGAQQIELLRANWPQAFPIKSHEVRPLASNAKQTIIEAFGWGPPYASAVLMVWKLRTAYCQATLCHPTRINLDGSASDEAVDDQARASAKGRLARIAARRAHQAENAEKKRLRAAAKDSAQPQAPEPAPTEIPEPTPEAAAPAEPPKARRLLVAGSAAMEAALKRRLAGGTMTTEILRTVAAPSSAHKREQRAR